MSKFENPLIVFHDHTIPGAFKGISISATHEPDGTLCLMVHKGDGLVDRFISDPDETTRCEHRLYQHHCKILDALLATTKH